MRKKKFTIIELLVVITIITILASLLLPALSRARSYGTRISCANNMRQVGYIVMNYNSDNGDIIIPALYFGGYWSSLLKAQGYLDSLSFYDPGPLSSACFEPKIFSCPSQKIALPLTGTSYLYSRVNWAYQHYALNYSISRFCSTADISSGVASVFKMSSRKRPSQALWITDANVYSVNAYSPVSPIDCSVYYAFVPRHNNGVNIFFLDGHAGYWSTNNLLQMKSKVGTPDGNAIWNGL